MKLIYAQQPLEKSIFLAGPTPRSPDVPSWRPEAIEILKNLGYDGTVFIPEDPTGKWESNYDNQIYWEWEALNQATVVVFWVPRELETLPGFTTNVEFGLMVASSKVLLGSPIDAPKMKYLDMLALRYNVPIYNHLHEIMDDAFTKTVIPFGE